MIEDLAAQIAALTDHINGLNTQRARLQTILDGPRVQPVIKYWRYNELCEDDTFEDIRSAAAYLVGSENAGDLVPIGIWVGGARVVSGDHDELRKSASARD